MSERFYYLYLNNEKIGPVPFEQLKNYNLSMTSQVWWEGADDWQYVKDVPEIASFFSHDKPNNATRIDTWVYINIFIQIIAILLPLAGVYDHYEDSIIVIITVWRIVSFFVNLIAIFCVYKQQYTAARVLAVIASIPTLPLGAVGIMGINRTIKHTQNN